MINQKKTKNQEPRTRYVWLLNDGSFSNSWDKKTHTLVDNEMIEIAKSNGSKLIEYKCLSDDSFEFYNMMKLK